MAAGDLVTVSEAARRLGIDKSVVSRQVRKLGLAKDAAGRFDLDEYRQRREAELNPLMARRGGMAIEARGIADDDPAMAQQPAFAAMLEDAAIQPAIAVKAVSAFSDPNGVRETDIDQRHGSGGAVNANTAVKLLQAQRLQLDLDEKRGKLIDRALVVELVTTGSRQLRDGLMALPSRLAGELASMTDAAEIKARLDEEFRRLLEAMAAGFAALEAGDGAEGESRAA